MSKTKGKTGYYNGAIIALNRLEEVISEYESVKVNGQPFIAKASVLAEIGGLQLYYQDRAKGNKKFWAKVKKNKESEVDDDR